jgi:hypothetical protein
MPSQRLDKAKYLKTQINDINEEILFANKKTKNPMFVDIESPVPKRKSNLITKTSNELPKSSPPIKLDLKTSSYENNAYVNDC